MTELLWQSTLLLALAFFFGAVFACGLKRRYWYARASKQGGRASRFRAFRMQPAPDQPKIEVAPRAAPEGERFGRAISGQSAPDGTRSDIDGVIRGGSDGRAALPRGPSRRPHPRRPLRPHRRPRRLPRLRRRRPFPASR